MQVSIDTDLEKDFVIRRLRLEIERLTIELEAAYNKPIEWLSPLEVADISDYSAYQVRKIIDRAAEGKDSRLINRVHYRRHVVCDKFRYKINWDAVKELI